MKVDKAKWRKAALSEICSIQMGQSPDSSSYNTNEEGLPFYQGNADFGPLYPTPRIYCNAPTRIANEGDLLISVRAPIGAINIANSKCCIGRGLASIKSKDGLSYIPYLKFLLRAYNKELNNLGTGMTFKAINKKALHGLPILAPKLNEQRVIAAELDAVQAMIDGYREQLADLNRLAQSFFLDTFGDPISNPKGWEISSLKNISLNNGTYGAPSPSLEKDVNRPRYIRITDIKDNGELNDDYVVSANFEDDATFLLKYGDILFARTGATVGKTYLYNTHTPQIYAGYLIKFSIDINKNSPIFVFYITQSESYKKWVRDQIIGVAQPNVNAQKYGVLPIILPPLSLQQQFAEQVEAIERQKEAIRQQLADAEILMAERMQYYFS